MLLFVPFSPLWSLFFFFGYFLHRFGEEMRPVKLTTKVFGTLYVPYPFKISRSIYSPNLQKNNSIGPGLIRNPKGTKHKITIGGWEWQWSARVLYSNTQLSSKPRSYDPSLQILSLVLLILILFVYLYFYWSRLCSSKKWLLVWEGFIFFMASKLELSLPEFYFGS